MLGKHHVLCGAATGAVAGHLLTLPPGHLVPALVLCSVAALLPDVDEPGSLIGRQMPALVGLFALAWWLTTVWDVVQPVSLARVLAVPVVDGGMVLFSGLVVGAVIPVSLKWCFGHRGLVHHPLLGALLLAGGMVASAVSGTVAPAIAALGWNVHLVGDALTVSGLPWRRGQRWWLLPRPLRFRTGGRAEVVVLVLWIGVALWLVGPSSVQRIVGQ